MDNLKLNDNGRAGVRAGVAKIEITTDSGLKINDPLYAKVLVLADENTNLIIVTMDTTAIAGRTVSAGFLLDVADDFMPKLRARVNRMRVFTNCNIMVTASHTHPPGPMLCNDDEQIDRISDAISRAVQNMTLVTIGVGTGHEDKLTINRNVRMKNGKDWPIRMWEPCPEDKNIKSVGPIDPDIGIVRIDRIDGTPLAVIYNFASHLLQGVPSGGITADFPGVTSKLIEDSLGDDVMAMFIQGANGDICEINDKNFDRPRGCEEFGLRLGLSTLNAWRQISPHGNMSLSFISDTIELPRRTDIPRVIKLLEKEQEDLLESLICMVLNFKSFLPLYLKHLISPDYPAQPLYRYLQEDATGNSDQVAMDTCNKRDIDKYLANIQVMERLSSIRDKIYTLKKHQKINDDAGKPTISAEIQIIKIADCVFVTTPIELLVEIGLRLKEISPYKYTFVASDCNGYMHYGVPAEYYERGGYEATECLLAPQWQQIFETKVVELLNKIA